MECQGVEACARVYQDQGVLWRAKECLGVPIIVLEQKVVLWIARDC